MDRRNKLAWIVAGALAAACGSSEERSWSCPVELWVSPDGRAGSPGDRAQPFATLEEARDAIRAHPLRGACAFTVTLRGGIHRRTSAFVLEPRDSGAPGKPVV